MTTLEIIAAIFGFLAAIVVILAARSANDDWNAEGYGMDKNTDRENFEAWALTDDGNCDHQDLRKNRDGEYINQLVERDFLVWQACTKFASPAAELTDAIERANARLIAYPEPVAELSDEHLELIQRIEKRLGWIESGLEINEIDFAKDIRSLLARSPAQPEQNMRKLVREAAKAGFIAAAKHPQHLKTTKDISESAERYADLHVSRALATPAAPEQKAAQPAAGIDMGCLKLNDACWAFVGAMPHQIPGPIWNDLKPAVKVAIEKYLAALSPAQSESKDAERYRWLRNPDHDVALVIDKQTDWVPSDDAVPGVGGYWTYEYRAGEELDAAIDTAMQTQKKESGNGE